MYSFTQLLLYLLACLFLYSACRAIQSNLWQLMNINEHWGSIYEYAWLKGCELERQKKNLIFIKNIQEWLFFRKGTTLDLFHRRSGLIKIFNINPIKMEDGVFVLDESSVRTCLMVNHTPEQNLFLSSPQLVPLRSLHPADTFIHVYLHIRLHLHVYIQRIHLYLYICPPAVSAQSSPVSDRSLKELLSALLFSPSPIAYVSSRLARLMVPFPASFFSPDMLWDILGLTTPFCFSSSAVNIKNL